MLAGDMNATIDGIPNFCEVRYPGTAHGELFKESQM